VTGNDQATGTSSDRTRRLVLAAAAVLAVAVVIALIAVAVAGSGDGKRPSAAASSSSGTSGSAAPTTAPQASGSAAPAAPAPGNPVSGDELPPSMTPVAFDQVATGDTGVSARLTAIEAIQGTGTGPGNVNGPALRLTVSVTNGAAQDLSLDGVQVTMTYGADQAPASPLNDPSQAAFGGVLQPGRSAEGRYVFSVPEDARDVVTVTVGYAAGAPFLVFTGSAA
jgi:hypothetical protein